MTAECAGAYPTEFEGETPSSTALAACEGHRPILQAVQLQLYPAIASALAVLYTQPEAPRRSLSVAGGRTTVLRDEFKYKPRAVLDR